MLGSLGLIILVLVFLSFIYFVLVNYAVHSILFGVVLQTNSSTLVHKTGVRLILSVILIKHSVHMLASTILQYVLTKYSKDKYINMQNVSSYGLPITTS